MLRASVLFLIIRAICSESPTLWGSSVITDIAGPSPLLRYVTPEEPYVELDEQRLDIKNGRCYIRDEEVGKHCSITSVPEGFLTKIQLFFVAQHKHLKVLGDITHTTFFAPMCRFGTPLSGDAILEPSLPFSRFLKGFNEVNITFAKTAGAHDAVTQLWDAEGRLCSWKGRDRTIGDPTFCQLTPRNNYKELWFSGIFHRGNRNDNSYEWGGSIKTLVSVSVDWTQTGQAPEDTLCAHVHRRPYYQRVYAPQLNSNPPSGLTSLLVLTLLR
ncbi:hypothetical protein AAHC03_017254 [Spirometra sp. Aus1]